MLRFGLWSVCLALLLASPVAAQAQQPKPPEQPKSPLAALLERPIVEPETALKEVKRFTEARVPPMPAVTTIAEWEQHAARMRQDVLDRVIYRGEAAAWRDAETKVEWLDTIAGGPGYQIKKLRYEALPGMWIPALLYVPERLDGKVPVVLNVNGHDRQGKAADYKQMRCINQAKRGMLALNVEWFGMGQLSTAGYSHARLNQLDLCGTSGLAPFYLAMKRGLDVLLSLEHADPERVAVAGLSGGGWQTILISSLDTRVTLSNPVAGYSSFRTRAEFGTDLGDSEQTPVDLATAADYAQLTALRAPRPTLLTFNAKDNCCFKADHALPPLLDAAGPIFKLYGKPQNLRFHINEVPGDHNFGLENREAFYRMLGDHFAAGDAAFKSEEIPSDAELKTLDDLQVEIPERNADFHSLAMALSPKLPRHPEFPSDAASAEVWQRERREKLRHVIHARKYDLHAEVAGAEQQGDVQATFWRFKLGTDWTVPAVELVRGEPQATTLFLSDLGRAKHAAEIEKLLAAGHRVLAVDPFYFGESQIAQRGYLFQLLISAVGERPLGVEAGQIAAIARWLHAERQLRPVKLAAIGPRTSACALVTAALEIESIGRVELQDSLGSLKELLEQNQSFDQSPELFCFGLLEEFDLRQLGGLIAPRPVAFVNPSERAQTEFAPLREFYGRLGVDFQTPPKD
jgi:dienelactone hydrolase